VSSTSTPAAVLAELPITIDRDRPVVLDLSDLTLCDTIGLSGLLTVRGRVVAERGDLVLRRPTPTVRSLLEITKLTPVLPIVD
jgi:anti-anti-sigma factor